MKIKTIIFTGLLPLFFSISVIWGQEHKETHQESHEFKHVRLALGIGHAHIPSASGYDDNYIAIPTWGFDAQYWFNEKWALGLKGDLEIATYVIENDHESEIERETPFILALPLFYSPWENNGLLFFTGPGIEIEQSHNFFVYRMGVGYEFHLAKGWDFEPEFIYDLKDGNVNSFTFAIGVGKRL